MSPRARQRAWTEPKQNASHHRGGHLEANSLEALTLLKRVSCSALIDGALPETGTVARGEHLVVDRARAWGGVAAPVVAWPRAGKVRGRPMGGGVAPAVQRVP